MSSPCAVVVGRANEPRQMIVLPVGIHKNLPKGVKGRRRLCGCGSECGPLIASVLWLCMLAPVVKRNDIARSLSLLAILSWPLLNPLPGKAKI
jgi:hypothetical protein